MPSVISPNSSIRARPSRPRLKSISANRIDRMQEEVLSSPDKTVRMSRINEENRQLQAQLKDWEMRYDESLRDVVQRQAEVERALRSKNTCLEDYATKAKDRVAELEAQLQQTQSALQAAETANVQLEKRVEIMSDLLTSAPARSEPRSETPARKRLHIRPRSMLPRLSTTGSWVGAFERTPESSSPGMSATYVRENGLDSFEPLEPIVSREVSAFSPRQSTAGYDSDERPFSATSTTFSDNVRQSIDTITSSRSARPMRRMRRFGPGGGPKPLILPFTSNFDTLPATAPASEQYEAFPSFPLERYITTDSGENTSPVRSRSNSMAHDETLARLVGSPGPRESSDSEITFRRMLTLARQGSSSTRPLSYMSTGSDFGGLVSRNLLEELNNAKLNEIEKKAAELEHTDGGAEQPVDSAVEILDSGELSDAESLDDLPAIQHEDFKALLFSSPMTLRSSTPATPQFVTESVEMDVFNPALEGIMGPLNNSSPASETTPRAVLHGRAPSLASFSTSDTLSLSTLDRLRVIFGDILHNPVDMARLIIHVTQQRMHVPAPLLSVPWWLVSMLWAPMARRRLLLHEQPSRELSSIPESTATSATLSTAFSTPSLAVSENLAYGTMYSSPSSRGKLRKRPGMAGPGRKRASTSKEHEHDSLLARHSPLLWAKFSLTLAYAVGTAFTAGPGSLLPGKHCPCKSCRGLDN